MKEFGSREENWPFKERKKERKKEIKKVRKKERKNKGSKLHCHQ